MKALNEFSPGKEKRQKSYENKSPKLGFAQFRITLEKRGSPKGVGGLSLSKVKGEKPS